MEPHQIEWQRNGEIFRIAIARVTHNAALDVPRLRRHADTGRAASESWRSFLAVRHNEQKAVALRASYVYIGPHRQEDRSARAGRTGGWPDLRSLSRGREACMETDQENGQALRMTSSASRTTGWRGVRHPDSSSFDRHWGARLARCLSPHVGFQPILVPSGFETAPSLSLNMGRSAGVEPRRPIERQFGKMAGTIWIDETDHQVIRIIISSR